MTQKLHLFQIVLGLVRQFGAGAESAGAGGTACPAAEACPREGAATLVVAGAACSAGAASCLAEPPMLVQQG